MAAAQVHTGIGVGNAPCSWGTLEFADVKGEQIAFDRMLDELAPLAESDFFEDGSGARPPVEGTVARGELRADRVFHTAIGPDGKFVATLPVPLTRALLLRGQERFNIFCSPCHGRVGDGRGMIVERGFKQPPRSTSTVCGGSRSAISST